MCDHTHTVLAITGGFTFDPQSGPEDDIREQVYCLDCGQTVPDAQQTADKPQTEIELTFSF